MPGRRMTQGSYPSVGQCGNCGRPKISKKKSPKKTRESTTAPGLADTMAWNVRGRIFEASRQRRPELARAFKNNTHVPPRHAHKYYYPARAAAGLV